jgi:hypothetical protein
MADGEHGPRIIQEGAETASMEAAPPPEAAALLAGNGQPQQAVGGGVHQAGHLHLPVPRKQQDKWLEEEVRGGVQQHACRPLQQERGQGQRGAPAGPDRPQPRTPLSNPRPPLAPARPPTRHRGLAHAPHSGGGAPADPARRPATWTGPPSTWALTATSRAPTRPSPPRGATPGQ